MQREEIKKNLKLDFKNPIIIFTQHSVTTEFNDSTKQIRQSLIAIKKLLLENVQVIITYPNNDAGEKILLKRLINGKRVIVHLQT